MSVSHPKDLLGKAETSTLEFKAAEILKNPAKVAREVVGFLNAGGGDVWIGVQESNGIAVTLQAIPNAERERDALRDYFMSTIEPPIRDEIDLEVVPIGDGTSLLRIRVKKGARVPYAQLHRGRQFWTRVDSRLRDMTRDEIFDAARHTQPKNEERLTRVVSDLRRQQADVAEIAPSRLWIQLALTKPAEINFQDQTVFQQFRIWLTDPKATGNRPSGWNLAHAHTELKRRVDAVEIGDRNIPWVTKITSNGFITFAMTRNVLSSGGSLELSPYPLMEYSVSAFRLMAVLLKVYGAREVDGQVVAAFTITGVQGAVLRPGNPKFPLPPWKRVKEMSDSVLSIDPEKLTFDEAQVRDQPDRCGLRVVRYIYDSFDFESGDIPPEFDQQQGVLILQS